MRGGILIVIGLLTAGLAAGDSSLVRVELAGPTWVLLDVTVLEMSVIHLRTKGEGGSVSLAIAYQGGVRVNSIPAARLNGSIDVAVWADSFQTGVQVVEPDESGGIGAGLGLFPGQYDVLLIGGGKRLVDIHYEIDESKVIWTEVARGPEVIYLDVNDFSGGVGASSGAFAASVAAGALGKHVEEVEGAFFGWYGLTLLPTQPALMTASSGGDVRTCPCKFYDIAEPTYLAPGDWAFDWSGARVDVSTPIIFGADVAWPGLGP